VGSHKVNKNLPRLFQAYAASGVRNNVRLILTGQPDADMMRDLQNLSLAEHVIFIGFPGNEDLSGYYRGALAVVFPSLYEGFGLPAVEAMACGTPVLTSNVCSLPEIVGDAGILVDPQDIEAIADGIRRLVEDASLIDDLRQRGLERARQFTWEKTAAKTSATLISALADSKSRSR
jgi:glycosyltransferase involved in cell wall biosynthesis